MCAVELVRDRATKAPILDIAGANKALGDKLEELGVLTRVAGANLFLAPPLTVTAEEVDDMVRIVDEAITHMESTVGLA
jgi:adenosylmethionine-8-amino-7-oxononanoate aminotransferase